MIVDIKKKYKTRDGRPVTDLFCEAPNPAYHYYYPLSGKIPSPTLPGKFVTLFWTGKGRILLSTKDHGWDLIEDNNDRP
jgi:hypothetical protein